MMLPILLTSQSKNNSPLVQRKRTLNDDPREIFDLNTHIFNRRASDSSSSSGGANGTTHGGALNATETKGELLIKKATYFDESLRLGVEENVKRQVNNLADGEFIQSQWALGRNVTVHGWVYSLSSGLIRDLAVSRCMGGSCWNMGRTDGYGRLQ
jgi:hypothetical protein